MSRKDYAAIAAVIVEAKKLAVTDKHYRHAHFAMIHKIQDGLAGVFYADNERFNSNKFEDACELTD